ncbi:hypothetical protein TNCV_4243001 [Trichonephila clavipes]|nr:hypothetical protein TNCV_4243001 [Trichonephila clavipes]
MQRRKRLQKFSATGISSLLPSIYPIPAEAPLESSKFCAGSGLKKRPYTVIHGIEILLVGRPFFRRYHVWKIRLAVVFVSWCTVFLKRSVCICKMLLGLRKYNSFKNLPLVQLLIDFNALFHKKPKVLCHLRKFRPKP